MISNYKHVRILRIRIYYMMYPSFPPERKHAIKFEPRSYINLFRDEHLPPFFAPFKLDWLNTKCIVEEATIQGEFEIRAKKGYLSS